MADRRPLAVVSGAPAEIPAGDAVPVAAGGTGATNAADALAALNGLDRRILILSGDPGTGDIQSGTVRVAKNTSTGRLSLWANDGGAMVDLLILSTP